MERNLTREEMEKNFLQELKELSEKHGVWVKYNQREKCLILVGKDDNFISFLGDREEDFYYQNLYKEETEAEEE